MKLEEVNNLPAYAVYKNLIPGVKVYQDTNQQAAQLSKRQQRKRKANSLKTETGGEEDKSVASTQQTTPSKVPEKKQDKKTKRRRSAAKLSKKESDLPIEDVNLKVSKAVPVPVTDTSANASKKKARVVGDTSAKRVNNVPLPKEAKMQNKNKKSKLAGGKEIAEEATAREAKKGKKKVTRSSNGTSLGQLETKTGKKPAKKLQLQVKEAEASYEHEEAPVIPLKSLMSGRRVENSFLHGKNMFQWLIHPIHVKEFMSKHWEKAPVHIKRSDVDPEYYKWILSSAKIDEIMRKNVIRFGKNIDITSYTDGQRETHNPVGRAMPAAVWDYYANGCSVRFLNPQTYSKPLWRLNATLQEYFGTFVGANLYLTPPDTQGFAPHYDDIEAFILQVEGKKHWKVYKPRNPNEDLARFSSPNFSEETDGIGEPVLDVVVEEGDLLYFPRGYIHQGRAVGEHSLHVTLSCYQTHSWGDLLKEYFSAAVDRAMATNVEFRRGLPIDQFSYMGMAHEGSKKKLILKKRQKFMKKVKALTKKLLNSTTPDAAVDQLGKKFMWDSLPPYLTEEEKSTTCFNDGEFMEEGQVFNRCEIDPDVEVKLVRKNCVRLVSEEDTLRLYFTLENSMEYHGEEPQFVEIPQESASVMKHLINVYPKFVKIEDLPTNNLTTKLQLVADLWERGVITTKEPLTPAFDDENFVSDDDDEDSEELSDEMDEFDEEDYDDEDSEESNEFDEFIDDRDIAYYDDGDECSEEVGTDDGDDFSDFSGDSQTTEDSLGKSYIEEINSGEENDDSQNGNENETVGDDQPPQLVTASPRVKTPRKGK